jgi:hypothetical protein
MITTLFLAAAVAAVPSTSKLGVRVVGDDATSQALLAADPCPRLTVFPVPSNGTAGAQITGYETSCPSGRVIAQITGQDGIAVSAAIADQVVPVLLALVPAGAQAVEGPAGVTGTSADVAAFWAEFAVLIHNANLTPVVPAGAGTAFCPIAGAVGATGVTWWWSWRALSPMTQGADETPTTLGYRAVLTACTSSLAGVPLAVTDIAPAGRAWQSTDDAWLRWFDARLGEDGEALGAALTSAGTPVESLAPVASALLAQLANPALPDGGTPDAGVDGGGAGIVNPHPGTDGELVPVHTKGCAHGTGGGALLGILPVLFALRRHLRRR